MYKLLEERINEKKAGVAKHIKNCQRVHLGGWRMFVCRRCDCLGGPLTTPSRRKHLPSHLPIIIASILWLRAMNRLASASEFSKNVRKFNPPLCNQYHWLLGWKMCHTRLHLRNSWLDLPSYTARHFGCSWPELCLSHPNRTQWDNGDCPLLRRLCVQTDWGSSFNFTTYWLCEWTWTRFFISLRLHFHIWTMERMLIISSSLCKDVTNLGKFWKPFCQVHL